MRTTVFKAFFNIYKMFEASLLHPHYQQLIGWKQHYDTTDIEIPMALTLSETDEYFQQKHPALDLAVIRSTLPQGYTLDRYLEEKVKDSTVELFNDILQYRQVNQYGRTLLQTSTLLNKLGWRNDGIVNRNRFVGLRIELKASSGLRMAINEIGTQFSQEETFDLHLFHSSKEDPIKTVSVNTSGNFSWKWQIEKTLLNAFESEEFYGGFFVLGYYQEDLTGMAINYSNFDWRKGECGTCNSSRRNTWSAITKYFHILPLYVPEGSFDRGKMFDPQKAFYTYDQSFGLNLRLSVECDLTEFFIENKKVFKNLLALKVTHKVLYDMKFSMQTNYVEEQLKMMIIRDLEGDKETNYLNLTQQYNREMKAVQFNLGSVNTICLPCQESATVPIVGSV